MKSIEMGSETARYIGKTAIEISGIGRARRAFKEEMTREKPEFVDSLSHGVVYGAVDFASPLASKSLEDKKGLNWGLIIDMAQIALLSSFVRSGDYQAAFIAKFGYNLLVQIAPDVAKLAKGKIFQRAK